MLGDWVALQILVKIADDIPGAKLTYRGIKHIIRSYNIELDKDTMDLMCEKILNSVAYLDADSETSPDQKTHTTAQACRGQHPHTGEKSIPTSLVGNSTGKQASRPPSSASSSRNSAGEQANTPSSLASSSCHSAGKQATRPPSLAPSSRNSAVEQANTPSSLGSSSCHSAGKQATRPPSLAPSSRNSAVEQANTPSSLGSSSHHSAGEQASVPPSRGSTKEQADRPPSFACHPTTLPQTEARSFPLPRPKRARLQPGAYRVEQAPFEISDDDFDVPSEVEDSDEADIPSKTARSHELPQSHQPTALAHSQARAPTTQSALSGKDIDATRDEPDDNGELGCLLGCQGRFSDQTGLLDHYIYGKCEMLSDPSTRLQHCAYNGCDMTNSCDEARKDHWDEMHAEDAFRELSTVPWTDVERQQSLDAFTAPPDDFAGVDVLRYEYLNDPTISFPRRKLSRYTATALEQQWGQFIRRMPVDTAYNADLVSIELHSSATVIEDFVPILDFDHDLDEPDEESNDETGDYTDQTAEQTETSDDQDPDPSPEPACPQNVSPADMRKFEQYEKAGCVK
ncbi:hypothetical protein KCV07_g1325, partial [Aureobasidium melanogenum]